MSVAFMAHEEDEVRSAPFSLLSFSSAESSRSVNLLYFQTLERTDSSLSLQRHIHTFFKEWKECIHDETQNLLKEYCFDPYFCLGIPNAVSLMAFPFDCFNGFYECFCFPCSFIVQHYGWRSRFEDEEENINFP
jgi:hypothetical protein